jgi:hypothetical protein
MDYAIQVLEVKRKAHLDTAHAFKQNGALDPVKKFDKIKEHETKAAKLEEAINKLKGGT